MKREIKILSLEKLARVLDKLQETYAPKEIEDAVMNITISAECPQNQSIGDLWFVEQERN